MKLHLGGIPVFADIEPDTCNIDAAQLKDLITDKTRAIIPVSLFGQPADMDVINYIAEKNNLIVIEDGAQSFGAEFEGENPVIYPILGANSFFPSKPWVVMGTEAILPMMMKLQKFQAIEGSWYRD